MRRSPCHPRPVLTGIATVVVFLAGCTGGDPGADPTAPTGTVEAQDSPTSPGTASERGGADVGVGFDAIPGIVREVAPSTVAVNLTVQQDGQVAQGAGSGVIWREDGIVVTNHHVIADGGDLEVVLASGERHPAEVVASDPRTDLAVVSIDAEGLPAAAFADRVPEVGELAVAIGNPLGFENTATAGIVSAVDRELPATQQSEAALVGLIQTDAPISSGNSGGALVNADAEVMGINVAAVSPPGGVAVAENVGFAIPASTVTDVVAELLENGEVEHAYLGVRGTTLTPQVAEQFDVGPDQGFVVTAVEPDGPAAQAGIEPGDVVVGIAGEAVATFGDLATVLRDHAPGDTVSVTRLRQGEEATVEVTLGALPE